MRASGEEGVLHHLVVFGFIVARLLPFVVSVMTYNGSLPMFPVPNAQLLVAACPCRFFGDSPLLIIKITTAIFYSWLENTWSGVVVHVSPPTPIIFIYVSPLFTGGSGHLGHHRKRPLQNQSYLIIYIIFCSIIMTIINWMNEEASDFLRIQCLALPQGTSFYLKDFGW